MVEELSVVRCTVHPGGPPLRTSAAVLLAALGLAACSPDTSLLGSSAPVVEQTPLQQVGAKTISRMVSFRPPVGPPEEVGSELTRQLNDAALEHGIALIIDPTMKLDLGLRGYVTALRKGSAVNITYLWDVVDGTGKRVNRIAGEEALVNGVDLKRPWTAVTPVVSRMIAQRTMADLGQWIKASTAATPQPSQAVAAAAP